MGAFLIQNLNDDNDYHIFKNFKKDELYFFEILFMESNIFNGKLLKNYSGKVVQYSSTNLIITFLYNKEDYLLFSKQAKIFLD